MAQFALEHHDVEILSSGLRLAQHLASAHMRMRSHADLGVPNQSTDLHGLSSLASSLGPFVCELATQLLTLVLTGFIPSTLLQDLSQTVFILTAAEQAHISRLVNEFVMGSQAGVVRDSLQQSFHDLLSSTQGNWEVQSRRSAVIRDVI